MKRGSLVAGWLALLASLAWPSAPSVAQGSCSGACNSVDASASAPSLSGLNLLGTLAARPGRNGYIVQAQDTSGNCSSGGGANGLLVAFDDGTGNDTPTVLIAGYASAKGDQGGSISMSGMPHTGRIRYFGTAGCQVGAAQW